MQPLTSKRRPSLVIGPVWWLVGRAGGRVAGLSVIGLTGAGVAARIVCGARGAAGGGAVAVVGRRALHIPRLAHGSARCICRRHRRIASRGTVPRGHDRSGGSSGGGATITAADGWAGFYCSFGGSVDTTARHRRHSHGCGGGRRLAGFAGRRGGAASCGAHAGCPIASGTGRAVDGGHRSR